MRRNTALESRATTREGEGWLLEDFEGSAGFFGFLLFGIGVGGFGAGSAEVSLLAST